MRALLVCALVLSGGCSLIFDGKDLRGIPGQGDGGADLAAFVNGSTDLAAGDDGGDGDGGSGFMVGDAGWPTR